MQSSKIRYLDSTQVRAFRAKGAAHPRIEILDDQTILAARVKRAFPLSRPGEFLSIQTGDNKEVGVLRSVEGLDAVSAEILSEELDRRYYTPRIQRIDTLRQEAGMWKFTVLTQRGATEFFVRNWRDNAHEISLGRWQIMSVDGGRFEIENLEKLDARSQQLMDQLL